MNKNVVLQRKSAELIEDIQDILHASSINLTAVCSEASQPPISTLHREFDYTQRLLETVKEFVNSRSENFMGFMITRQIQEEEERVRRERLTEYEEKIYDQKRIITDKQCFFQSLLRPKRKRPTSMTPEQFQEIRMKEREGEQKVKQQQLVREMLEIQSLRRFIDEQEREKKKAELQSTKSTSANITGVEDLVQIATERIVSHDDRSNKENKYTHMRNASMQHTLNREPLGCKKQDSESDMNNAKLLYQEIRKLNSQNEILHNIYDQQLGSLKFKQTQKTKLKQQYDTVTEQLKKTREKEAAKKQMEKWRYQRVASPIQPSRRRADSK